MLDQEFPYDFVTSYEYPGTNDNVNITLSRSNG